MPRPRVPRPPGSTRPATLLAALGATLLAAPARPAAAQELLGRVVETPSGRALGGVGVRLYRVAAAAPGAPADSGATDASPVRSAVTAADGAFALFPPEPGTYRVRVGAGALAPAVTLAADSSVQRVYAVPLDYAAPLYPAQVDKAAVVVPRTVDLRYPFDLFRANVTGCAAVELVVDTAGRTEKRSARPVAATRREFARAGVDALAKARFTPAVRDGRPVRAVVVVPFVFQIVEQRVPDLRPCEVAGGVARDPIIVTAGYTF
jgi:TonB family protein